jgi:hypothetical protein
VKVYACASLYEVSSRKWGNTYECGQHQSGGLDAQDAGAQVYEAPTAASAGSNLLVGETPFGSHRQSYTRRRGSRIFYLGCLLVFPRMRQYPHCRQIPPSAVNLPVSRRMNLQEHIPATLLAGFDDIAAELFELGNLGVHHTSASVQGDE